MYPISHELEKISQEITKLGVRVSELKEELKREKEIPTTKPYPKLMISHDKSHIILATGCDDCNPFLIGTVIDSKPNSEHKLGYYSGMWNFHNYKDYEFFIVLNP